MPGSQFYEEADFGGRQAKGQRKNQEDFYAFSRFGEEGMTDDGLLLVLADGMGGCSKGEHASRVSVEAFVDSFHYSYEEGKSNTVSLGYALRAANNAIEAEIAIGIGSEADMGTTLVGLSIQGGKLYWISVGDSPLYLFREGVLTRLNEDHSMRQVLDEQVEKGKLTRTQALKDPERNALLSALIGDEVPMVDWPEDPEILSAGDLILLASDGLETLTEKEISELLIHGGDVGAGTLAHDLVKSVLGVEKKGQDNTTVAIVRIPEVTIPDSERKGRSRNDEEDSRALHIG